MLSIQQIKWAASHDWFVRDNGNGTVTVRDEYFRAGDKSVSVDFLVWCKSFSALRAWAGY